MSRPAYRPCVERVGCDVTIWCDDAALLAEVATRAASTARVAEHGGGKLVLMPAARGSVPHAVRVQRAEDLLRAVTAMLRRGLHSLPPQVCPSPTEGL